MYPAQLLVIGLQMSILLGGGVPVSFDRETFRLPVMRVQDMVAGFALRPGLDCSTGWAGDDWCETTQPKPWKTYGLVLIGRLLTRLEADLPNFVRTVKANGFTSLYRYTHGTRRDPDGSHTRVLDLGGWVSYMDRTINITDLLVDRMPAQYIRPDFDLRQAAILHELAHAYAGAGSVPEEFLDMTGWARDGAGSWVMDEQGMRESELKLKHAGEKAESWPQLRDPGVVGLPGPDPDQKRRFPTLYSMESPAECFAEIVAYVYFDRDVSDYLDARIIRWIRTNVLN